jgi:hypothetical protein
LTLETFQHIYSLNADAAQYPTPLSPEELSKVTQVDKVVVTFHPETLISKGVQNSFHYEI